MFVTRSDPVILNPHYSGKHRKRSRCELKRATCFILLLCPLMPMHAEERFREIKSHSHKMPLTPLQATAKLARSPPKSGVALLNTEPRGAQSLSTLIAHFPTVIDGIIKTQRSRRSHLCRWRDDVQEGWGDAGKTGRRREKEREDSEGKSKSAERERVEGV